MNVGHDADAEEQVTACLLGNHYVQNIKILGVSKTIFKRHLNT